MMYYLHFLLAVTTLLIILPKDITCYPGEERYDMGRLEGDVQNWAQLIENYILQLANDGICRDFSQGYLDNATYTFEQKDGKEIVKQVKEKLSDYFNKKERAAQRLAVEVGELYDTFLSENRSLQLKSLSALNETFYVDSDIPEKLPKDRKFIPYFKQEVIWNHSTIKIADEVPRDDNIVINNVYFTAALEQMFKQNQAEDSSLRWQYFGSTAGIVRIYPGREWSTNFAGFYNDYDPRVRPWYIAATSGPKDVVIILDCSLSMDGEKFSIAKGVAKTVINTLTKQDYVSVICARDSYWDDVGKWHAYSTDVLSCREEKLVPATNAHRKDIIEKIQKLKAGGTSELEKGFTIGYDLLTRSPRTGCQSIIVFVTDGKDTDAESVRCGPGYYTRSGFVPGPVCKYNWTLVWDVAEEKQKYLNPQARLFSYLIKDDAEEFPGKLACGHRGSFTKLTTGENLISQMNNYFDFLSSNARSTEPLWTSPYLDAWGLGLMVTYAVPVISKLDSDSKTIGVVGVDATLDEIENFLKKHQWGNVISFLINDQGETIYHPKLKPSTNLLEDPIFIPVSQLEMDNNGKFSKVLKNMMIGREGMVEIEKAKDGKKRTYYYAALNESEYSFAYSLADTDMFVRRSQEPKDRSSYTKSYYNLLQEYKNLMKELPDAVKNLDIRENEQRYPGLTITFNYSTIFLPPKSHCDPTQYIYDDNLAKKTLTAHKWINSFETDRGCEAGQKFHKGIRADVLITQPIEEMWKKRAFESLDQVKWTNIGLRSGVFRTFPGHRSTRAYDPTQRPWYKRTSSAPWKTSISTPYMDAAGVGKINTISQAVFEGMPVISNDECTNASQNGVPLPGGCRCDLDTDCSSRKCYLSKATKLADHRRCATVRVEGVTGLDILYDDFHNKIMESMQASNFNKSCGQIYDCPDKEPGCTTRCYLFDSKANLVVDPDFITASNLDKSKYAGVQLGKKEGEVMKDLIYKHKFFIRKETLEFQGTCRITPVEPKVTLEGIPKNPAEKDDYFKNKGPIPQFSSEFGCIQDVVSFSANDTALGRGMLTGNVSGPCMSGFYYVTSLPRTNLYLLVIEDWNNYRETLFYNFNCRITRSIVNSGAHRIINGTCAHEDHSTSTLAAEEKCPVLRDLDLKCAYTHGNVCQISMILLSSVLTVTFTLVFS
ncbi:voltage-dependent calcium channel subunit alpha-2/delta-2-like [Mytilus trossulus]|uniref:voltage-dependent calcium channel subunit alpha-2/delta-2-like n=1 Tax=Mytilus trossulus TaxID=6551 RepID=UPI003005DE0B